MCVHPFFLCFFFVSCLLFPPPLSGSLQFPGPLPACPSLSSAVHVPPVPGPSVSITLSRPSVSGPGPLQMPTRMHEVFPTNEETWVLQALALFKQKPLTHGRVTQQKKRINLCASTNTQLSLANICPSSPKGCGSRWWLAHGSVGLAVARMHCLQGDSQLPRKELAFLQTLLPLCTPRGLTTRRVSHTATLRAGFGVCDSRTYCRAPGQSCWAWAGDTTSPTRCPAFVNVQSSSRRPPGLPGRLTYLRDGPRSPSGKALLGADDLRGLWSLFLQIPERKCFSSVIKP